jgi:hypothetical protein
VSPTRKLGLLILDWAPAHVGEEIKAAFRESQWVVIALVPGSTHFAQPLDGQPFAGLRPRMRQVLEKAVSRRRYTCAELMPVVYWAARQCATRKAVEDSFRHCGIVPYDPAALRSNWQRRSRLRRGQDFDLVNPAKTLVLVDATTGELATSEQQHAVRAG